MLFNTGIVTSNIFHKFLKIFSYLDVISILNHFCVKMSNNLLCLELGKLKFLMSFFFLNKLFIKVSI